MPSPSSPDDVRRGARIFTSSTKNMFLDISFSRRSGKRNTQQDAQGPNNNPNMAFNLNSALGPIVALSAAGDETTNQHNTHDDNTNNGHHSQTNNTRTNTGSRSRLVSVSATSLRDDKENADPQKPSAFSSATIYKMVNLTKERFAGNSQCRSREGVHMR